MIRFMRVYLGPLTDHLSPWQHFHEMKTLFKQSVLKKTDGEVIISCVILFPAFTLRRVVWVVCYSQT